MLNLFDLNLPALDLRFLSFWQIYIQYPIDILCCYVFIICRIRQGKGTHEEGTDSLLTAIAENDIDYMASQEPD